MPLLKILCVPFIYYLIVFLCFILKKGYAQDFGYSGESGPSHWGEKYSTCVGKHQSPIDISEHNIKLIKLDPLYYENFDEVPESASLTNNGHTVMMKMKSPKLPELSGGPLRGIYRFEQLHFHWGENDYEGSENKINNNSFPMELHMVFYKTEYENFGEALQHPDGLTVLAFLYKLSQDNNTHYDSILSVLHNVENFGTTVGIPDPVQLGYLLNNDKKKYFTYDGSLTTPPCSEIVIWIEYKNPIPLSHAQLETFRQLNNEEGKMTHNFRPTQPLYDRVIYFNSEDEIYDVKDNAVDKFNERRDQYSKSHKNNEHDKSAASQLNHLSFTVARLTILYFVIKLTLNVRL